MRYFLHLAFDGTQYSGWQRQKNTTLTVQEVLEQTLSIVFKKAVTAYGCGRTDAGVHASQFVAHVNLDEPPQFDLKFRLNKNLPKDIAIYEVIDVNDKNHCRYDATVRTYDYFLHWKKDPYLINYSTLIEENQLDFGKMDAATKMILNTQDFRPLCKQPDFYKNTLCNITRAQFFINEGEGRLRFTISSNRFLRGMVRLCVSFLLQVGAGKLSLDQFQQILNQELNILHKRPALPNGLFLSRVEYPFVILKESNSLIKMMKVGLE